MLDRLQWVSLSDRYHCHTNRVQPRVSTNHAHPIRPIEHFRCRHWAMHQQRLPLYQLGLKFQRHLHLCERKMENANKRKKNEEGKYGFSGKIVWRWMVKTCVSTTSDATSIGAGHIRHGRLHEIQFAQRSGCQLLQCRYSRRTLDRNQWPLVWVEKFDGNIFTQTAETIL